LIRKRAAELRERFSVKKAPVDVKELAERMGLVVVPESAPDELSGFLLRDPKKGRAIIGVNANHHPNRQRFTIAHECGHFLLHQGEKLHVDKRESGWLVKLRDGKSAAGTNVDEMEANFFAAELLMPSEWLAADLAKGPPLNIDDEERIKKLAKRYEVSAQALALRLQFLGWIQQ
jgi:Zn-dependent peptidase ImmA (M78 family)